MISVMVTPSRSSTRHNLAARDQTVVDIDVDGFADLAVELDDGPLAQFQELADFHPRFAEHGRHRDRNVEHGFEVGCLRLMSASKA